MDNWAYSVYCTDQINSRNDFLLGVGRGEKGREGAKPAKYLLCTDIQSTLRQLWKQGLCILAGGRPCNHLMKICKHQEKKITLPWGKRGVYI